MARDDDFEAAPQRYAALLPVLRETARAHGYTLAVHGSQRRDLDVVAVPWIPEMSVPEVLVEALRVAVGGFIVYGKDVTEGDYVNRNPTPKPHGRLAWAIHIGGRLYIDLSVMPVLSASPAAAHLEQQLHWVRDELLSLHVALDAAQATARVAQASQSVAFSYYRRTRAERDHARTLRRRAAQRAIGLRRRLHVQRAELVLLRELRADCERWREGGGDTRDQSSILETLNKLEAVL